MAEIRSQARDWGRNMQKKASAGREISQGQLPLQSLQLMTSLWEISVQAPQREGTVSRAGHGVPINGSRHPPPQKPEPVALQDKSGPDSGPSSRAQAGDSALNIAHECRPQPQPCRQNRPCAMLPQGCQEGPHPDERRMFPPQLGRGPKRGFTGAFIS